ncbi:MAG: ASKHA domain-containing protein [Peptococcaceae bacterium]|nr:ASKHA domain-containing protein [Peptococcaceae bacterium]
MQVTFLPAGKQIQVPAGVTVLEAAAAAGVQVEGTCGGRGTCGKCRVRVLSGVAGEPSGAEQKFLSQAELASGQVLACQCKLTGDAVIQVAAAEDAHRRKSLLGGDNEVLPVEPAVIKKYLCLNPPNVEDQTPDLERVAAAAGEESLSAGRDLLAALPRTLRQAGFKVTAVITGSRLAAVEQGDTTADKYGVAFDIGTTTVVGYLVNLDSGRVRATASATNPQHVHGADVISRIDYTTGKEGGLARMQQLVVSAMNGIISRLLAEAGVDRERVYEATVVGNTTMSHLFLGVDPAYLAPAPFVPAFRRALDVPAREIGLNIHPAGSIHVLPNIAGYVGSDTVGVMLATEIDRQPGITLAVDIGTNGEVVLAGRGRILTCSTAAGPAFEGAHIRCGMRAAAGAVESVRIDGDVYLDVIGGVPPTGICGSGILDAVAEMARAGILHATGRMIGPAAQAESLDGRLRQRIRAGDQGQEFVLAAGEITGNGTDLVLTQQDVRELQLAKGAIYAGIQLLLAELGIVPADIDRVLLAGAFGNYIKKESALAIGLLPPVPPERIRSVGNAAGAGARLALASVTERARAMELARRVEHVELSARKDFQQAFIGALNFPT